MDSPPLEDRSVIEGGGVRGCPYNAEHQPRSTNPEGVIFDSRGCEPTDTGRVSSSQPQRGDIRVANG